MSRPGFFFLVCPDAELTKIRIEALLAEHSPAGTEYERHVFWADEGLGRHFWESLTLQGLFDAPRIVVLRRAQDLLADDWEKLTGVLGRFNAQIWPFFCLETGFDRGKPKLPRPLTGKKYWTLAQKKGWLWQSAGLNGPGVVRYLKEQASAKGLRFAPGAAEALAAVVPTDASAIRRELEKIELATPDKVIGPEAADMVTFEPETDIFAFITALQKGRSPGEVWRQVLGGGREDEMLFPFLALLQREARILWRMRFGDDGDIRLPPSVRSAKQATAAKLGAGGLARIWDMALAAESGVKTGERSPAQAMDLLVADLYDLFSSRDSGGSAGRGRF